MNKEMFNMIERYLWDGAVLIFTFFLILRVLSTWVLMSWEAISDGWKFHKLRTTNPGEAQKVVEGLSRKGPDCKGDAA